jgi:hypothetical protein
MSKAEPPEPEPRFQRSTFLLGQDSRGHWVIQDEAHRCGGLFINRAEALKFALFENGNRPQGIVPVAGVLELQMKEDRDSAAKPTDGAQLPQLRRVA